MSNALRARGSTKMRLAEIQRLLESSKASRKRQDQWTVLAAYLEAPAIDPYQQVNKLLRDNSKMSFSFDVGASITEALKICQNRERAFLDEVLAKKAIPEIGSQERQGMDRESEREISLLESEAGRFMEIRELLQKRMIMLDAAVELWVNDNGYLPFIIRTLKDANYPGMTGLDPAVQVAIQSLETYVSGNLYPDAILRAGHATSLDQSADSNMRRSIASLDGAFSLPGHQRIAARIYFEMGEYENAFAALFPEQITLADYAPSLKWTELEGKSRLGVIRSIRSSAHADQLTVSVIIEENVRPSSDDPISPAEDSEQKPSAAQDTPVTEDNSDRPTDQDPGSTGKTESDPDNKTAIPVLRLSGLPPEDLLKLGEFLEGLDVRRLDRLGTMRDQILRAPLPLDPRRHALRAVMMESPMKELLIKSLAYGSSVPAQDIVKSGGWRHQSDNRKKIFDRTAAASNVQVREPALDELIHQLKPIDKTPNQ